MPKYTWIAEFTLVDVYSGDDVLPFKVKLDYKFTPGSPESGRSGPPENYDPGSDHEIFYQPQDLKFFRDELYVANVGAPAKTRQVEFDPGETLRRIIFDHLESHEDRMAEEASEEE